jgi:hypothetical protein
VRPIDTSTAAGKAFLDMLGVFARSRPICAASSSSKVAKAKLAGAYKGRPASIDEARVRAMRPASSAVSAFACHRPFERLTGARRLGLFSFEHAPSWVLLGGDAVAAVARARTASGHLSRPRRQRPLALAPV